MLELAFIACLPVFNVNGAIEEHCDKKSLLFSDVSPMTCMIGAQPQLAQWMNKHPEYIRITEWRCGYLRITEQEV